MTLPDTAQPDRVIAALRPHGRVLILPAILFVVTLGAMVWMTGAFRGSWFAWVVIIAGIVVIIVGCVKPFVSWLARTYTITARKIILQQGLFVRVRQELLHSRGYEVTVRRTAGQSLFRSGDIRINTTASEQPIDLKDVPNPVLVQSVLQDLVEGNAGASAHASDDANRTDATKRYDPSDLGGTQAI